jgi:hypothetical protein
MRVKVDITGIREETEVIVIVGCESTPRISGITLDYDQIIEGIAVFAKFQNQLQSGING